MADSLQKLQQRLQEVRSIWNRVNWSDPRFTVEKAYIAALFSAVAYLRIPKYELRLRRFVKIIPCMAYWQVVSKYQSFNLHNWLAGVEIGASYEIDGDGWAAVVVASPAVIVIALRGTLFYDPRDWATDLKCAFQAVPSDLGMLRVHAGFYRRITSAVVEIGDWLDTYLGTRTRPPVYIVGHSLGGGMAAIAHALSNAPWRAVGTAHFNRLGTQACYTLGMPRYADSLTVRGLAGPWHVFEKQDPVPRLVPRAFGYADARYNYQIERGGVVRVPIARGRAADRVRSQWQYLTGVRHHFIEQYIRRLGKLAGVP